MPRAAHRTIVPLRARAAQVLREDPAADAAERERAAERRRVLEEKLAVDRAALARDGARGDAKSGWASGDTINTNSESYRSCVLEPS